MSEHFSHIAMYEDTMRLMSHGSEICDAFKFCIERQYDSGLLGSTSRGNHLYAVPILEKYKDRWDAVKQNPDVQIQIAYAVGWVCHRACDLRMKPVFRAAEDHPNPRYKYDICTIYHDAMHFKQVYGEGKTPSVSSKEVLSPATFTYEMQSHPAAEQINVPVAEMLFNRMWQHELMYMNIFIKDSKDLENWADTFVTRFPDFSEDFRLYEKAYNDPDPELAAFYYDENNLYDETDPLLQFVRAVQCGRKVPVSLQEALDQAKDQSLYAQAIRDGYYFVKSASDYFTGQNDKESVYDGIQMNDQFRF